MTHDEQRARVRDAVRAAASCCRDATNWEDPDYALDGVTLLDRLVDEVVAACQPGPAAGALTVSQAAADEVRVRVAYPTGQLVAALAPAAFVRAMTGLSAVPCRVTGRPPARPARRPRP